MHFQRSDSIFGSPLKPSFKGKSRLETEFEELEVLGSGGFGDVIKVKYLSHTSFMIPLHVATITVKKELPNNEMSPL